MAILLEYELPILCALAALAIMRIISQRQRIRRQRELRRTIWHGIDASQDLSAIEQSIAQKTKHLEDEPTQQKYDNFVILVLILVLIWLGGRL